jgi:hypothetical protein
MHTASTARESLELLWRNYLLLQEQVDPESMTPETLDVHVKQNSLVRPLRIATWLARQGFFIAAWSLWEYYARSLCQSLTNNDTKARNESTVEWVARSLAANGVPFSDKDWFVSANCLRNLIAHSGARAEGSRGEKLLERCRIAFPDTEVCRDGYIDVTHCHAAELQLKIEEFIRQMANQAMNVSGGGVRGPR